MRRLEISVLNHSQVNSFENPTGRVDAEFFQKEFLALPRYATALGDIAIVRSGTTPSDRDDTLTEGVSLLKTVDIQNRPLNAADSDSFYKISPETAKRMEKTRLLSNDLLINIVGATTDVVGRVALVPEGLPEANITQAMALIRLEKSAVMSEVIFAFLAGKHGQAQVRRLARPTGQYNLNIPEVESIRVPTISPKIGSAVRVCVRKSLATRNESKKLLEKAEATLLRALGLENWNTPEPLSYVCSSRDAFRAGRLDAQHFQPRYAALSGYIQATGNGHLLGNWLLENQRGKQPDYVDDGLPVVNSKHVLRGEVRLDSDNRRAMYGDDDLLIHTGDVLMNGTGVGTIGRCAPYLHTANAIPDNHVTILSPKSGLDAVYLSVFLNSLAGQLQVEQRLRGSSGQIELYPNDIAQFNIWIAPPSVQRDVRHAVEQSFEKKQRSAYFLNVAKHAVEVAIEQDEKAAMAYLEANT